MQEVIRTLRFQGVPNNKLAHKKVSEEMEVRRQQIAARADAQTHEAQAMHIGAMETIQRNCERLKDKYYDQIRTVKLQMQDAAEGYDFALLRELSESYGLQIQNMGEEVRGYASDIRLEERRHHERLAQIQADKAHALLLLSIEMREAREKLWADALRLAIANREQILQNMAERDGFAGYGGRFESDQNGTDSNGELEKTL